MDRVSTPRASTVDIARYLRRTATPAERRAWSLLRHRGVHGLKFRRQHPLEGFIADFYCPARRLIVELDGCPHDSPVQLGYDRTRTEWLRTLGYSVVRLRNVEVTAERLEEVLRPFARPPSPVRGRGTGGED